MFSDNGGSEDESSWRHDLEEPFGMHRLRSSRTARADSLSGSEDDEDDGFEILTAENLFSTLLSRVNTANNNSPFSLHFSYSTKC